MIRNTAPSYANAIIASTAVVMYTVSQLCDNFNIQNPLQLAAYSLSGIIIGSTIVKTCQRKNFKLERKIE